MQNLIFKVQNDLCEEIEKIEFHKKFNRTEKKNTGGIEMVTILEDETTGVFEKVGIHASYRSGILPVSAFSTISFSHANLPIGDSFDNADFFTAGVSGVMYPKNPHVPTLNFNYRYFEIMFNAEKVWWFSGGTDLAPSILDPSACQHFHKVLRNCCDKYDKSFYKQFKKNCDDYFYLKHRNESRGIGGIFFENLNRPDQNKCFEFVSECMQSIAESYIPIVTKNKQNIFGFGDKQFQLLLWARYLEFLMISNKTIEIAIMSPGVHAENILIYLPPSVSFKYDYNPEEDTKEYELLSVLKNPREWI